MHLRSHPQVPLMPPQVHIKQHHVLPRKSVLPLQACVWTLTPMLWLKRNPQGPSSLSQEPWPFQG